MIEKAHYNDKGKLDGPMKAHFRRVFMFFDTAMNGKFEKNHFGTDQHKSFTHNNKNNECWFCDRDIAMACFLR